MEAPGMQTPLLPLPTVINVVRVTRQELVQLARAQAFLERVSFLKPHPQSLGISGALVVIQLGANGKVIGRRVRALEDGTQDAVGTRVITESGTEAYPLEDVLDGEPSDEQWKDACGEMAQRMLQGDMACILLQEVKATSDRLARLQRCADVLKDHDQLRLAAGGAVIDPAVAVMQDPGSGAGPLAASAAAWDPNLDVRLYDGLRYALERSAMREHIWAAWCLELRRCQWGSEAVAHVATHGCLQSPAPPRDPDLRQSQSQSQSQSQQHHHPDTAMLGPQPHQRQRVEERETLPVLQPTACSMADVMAGGGNHAGGGPQCPAAAPGPGYPANEQRPAALAAPRKAGLSTQAEPKVDGPARVSRTRTRWGEEIMTVEEAAARTAGAAAVSGTKPGGGEDGTTTAAPRGAAAADALQRPGSIDGRRLRYAEPSRAQPGHHGESEWTELTGRDVVAPQSPPPGRRSAHVAGEAEQEAAPCRTRKRISDGGEDGAPNRRRSSQTVRRSESRSSPPPQQSSLPLQPRPLAPPPPRRQHQATAAGGDGERVRQRRASGSRSPSPRLRSRSSSRSRPRIVWRSRSRSRSQSRSPSCQQRSSRKQRRGSPTRSRSRSPKTSRRDSGGYGWGGSAGTSLPDRGDVGRQARGGNWMPPDGGEWTAKAWSQEVYDFLLHQPGGSAPVTQLLRVGLAVPNHVLDRSGKKPSAFFYMFPKLWTVSGKGVGRCMVLTARADAAETEGPLRATATATAAAGSAR